MSPDHLICKLSFYLLITTYNIQGDTLNVKNHRTAGADSEEQEIFFPNIVQRNRIARGAEQRGSPVEIKFSALGRRFDFSLTPSPSLFLNNSVVLIRRKESSELLDVEELNEICVYQGRSSSTPSERVALNLCGGLRGVLTSPSEYYIIKPLREPHETRRKKREDDFWRAEPHLILRKKRWMEQCRHNNSTRDPDYVRNGKSYLHMQQEKYFPSFPDTSFNQIEGTGYFPSGTETANDPLDPVEEMFDQTVDGEDAEVGPEINIELAVFVDRDLHRYMAENFPEDTDNHTIQVVLAIINAVELLYSDKTLGVNMKFLIKRLEILQVDPAGLKRSYDIDRYLSNFCRWQKEENAPQESDLSWDHALILTGLDLHAVDSQGKVSNQVVGLAPVSGMCRSETSCTVNEGRHFESVYVMAHEIGHNLGMQHDGPESKNSCSPGSYIMSPTLGSGKIRWSKCSRDYLKEFLDSPQAGCLKDKGSVEVVHRQIPETLPGERFPSDVQCKLRYGSKSSHAAEQPAGEVCRDLHCRRDHFTWTSHPALEGTPCGPSKWCRAGVCVHRSKSTESVSALVHGGWSGWSRSDCRSACLYSRTGSLVAGSTGIIISTRSCTNPSPRAGGNTCQGPSFIYTSCNNVKECMKVKRSTTLDYAEDVCSAASTRDQNILPYGEFPDLLDPADHQDRDSTCTISCYNRDKILVSMGWKYPDGTRCSIQGSDYAYCVRGICKKFVCADDLSAGSFLQNKESQRLSDPVSLYTLPDSICKQKKMNTAGMNTEYLPSGDKTRIREWTKWRAESRCTFSCLVPARGLQIVSRTCLNSPCPGLSTTISLCEDVDSSCSKLLTPFQFASHLCSAFQLMKLSGIGMQLSSTPEDPDRACQVACQDSSISYRFYMVSGTKGWFPSGTDCSGGGRGRSYCVKGRCLQFGEDLTPVYLAKDNKVHRLKKFRRSLVLNSTSRIAGSIDQALLEQLVQDFNRTLQEQEVLQNSLLPTSSINKINFNFQNPVDLPVPDAGLNLSELQTNLQDDVIDDVIIRFRDDQTNSSEPTHYASYFMSAFYLLSSFLYLKYEFV